jgi:hypothetical protein
MNTKIEGRYFMKLATSNFLNQNPTITALLPGFDGFFTDYKNDLDKMRTLREKLEVSTSGITSNNKKIKNDVIEMAIDISHKMEAWAVINKNEILTKEVHLTSTALTKLNAAQLRDKAMMLHNKANAMLNDLTPYGINAELLARFNTLIDDLNTSIPGSRLGKNGKLQNKSQMNQLSKNTDDFLDKVDLLVEIVRVSQPTFYQAYKHIRQVPETSKSTLAAKGLITDASTGEPLKGVSIKFILEGDNSKLNGHLVKISAKQGGFYIKSLAPGIYNVTVSKIGYATQVVKLIINNGELGNLKVELQKL